MAKRTRVRDAVDRDLERWAEQLPELDLVTEGIVARVKKLAHHLKRSVGETLDAHDLTVGDWEVLTSLRREGPPYRSSPTTLARTCLLSSGGVTVRLDRLEEAGLVERLPDPDDRRGVLVQLTDAGLAAWEGAFEAQAAKEQLVAGVLGAEDRARLEDLLRRLLVAVEGDDG